MFCAEQEMSGQAGNAASMDDVAVDMGETERRPEEQHEQAASRESRGTEGRTYAGQLTDWEEMLPSGSAPIDVGVAIVSPLEVEFWQILSWGKVVVHYAALHFVGEKLSFIFFFFYPSNYFIYFSLQFFSYLDIRLCSLLGSHTL